MDLSIYSVTASYTTSTTSSAKSEKISKNETDKSSSAKTDGVVYEKSTATDKKSTDYSVTIAQLKADQEQRASQLIELVRSTISGQGKTFAKANSLADIFRNLVVDEETVAQAQKDIAEDGYWGVEQTSDRLVSMAQALAGGDSTKADELISAIKKGYEQATQAWGEELPTLCSDTLNKTIEKMEAWRDGITTA